MFWSWKGSLDDETLWLLQDKSWHWGSSEATMSPPRGWRDRSHPTPGKAVSCREWNVSLREREHKSLEKRSHEGCWALRRDAWHCLLHMRRLFPVNKHQKKERKWKKGKKVTRCLNYFWHSMVYFYFFFERSAQHTSWLSCQYNFHEPAGGPMPLLLGTPTNLAAHQSVGWRKAQLGRGHVRGMDPFLQPAHSFLFRYWLHFHDTNEQIMEPTTSFFLIRAISEALCLPRK